MGFLTKMNTSKPENGLENPGFGKMASPMKSQMFVLPNPDETFRSRRNFKGKKYKFLKTIELIVALATVFALLSGKNATEDSYQDLVVNIFIGFSIAYPLFVILFKLNFSNVTPQMIGLNTFMTINFLFIAYLCLRSWWEIEDFIEGATLVEPDLYYEAQYYLSMKFFAGLTFALNGVLYFSETLLLLLEVTGTI